MDTRFDHRDIEQSIPSRFAQQCRHDPGRIAVLTRQAAFTYGELDAWANAIAESIQVCTEGARVPLPFLLPQGPLAIATTLAILKTGSAYVPFDPSWPLARVAELHRDLAAPLVITDSEFAPALRQALGDTAVLVLAHERPEAIVAAPGVDIAPTAPAYIYFTSGSTGRPKGVVDCHRNVLHNVMRYTHQLAIGADDRLTLLQSCGFSGAVSSMFAALANGAASMPIDLRGASLARVGDWIDAGGATIYHSVPAIFRSLLTAGRMFRRLRVVRLEGDRATRLDLELFRAHVAPPCRVAVGLGATETGLVSQYFFDHTTPLPDSVVPIGHPVQDVAVEIRDADGNEAAPGIAGEIVVRSRYLALGYWNDAAATKRAFTDALSPDGERAYRTGDLGRRAVDGQLDYLGRLDGRVRVRGQWVELADVDAAIAKQSGVREAVTCAVDDVAGNTRLVAWLVADGATAINVSTLHRALAAILPAHMLPSRYVAVNELPQNDNGKVDRTRLPRPAQTRPVLAAPFARPRDLVQLRLCELWEQVLDLRPVGIDDDFFELGGDSLLAATMMSDVETLFGRTIPLSALLEGATVETLSRRIGQARDDLCAPIVAVRSGGAQLPLFFLHGDYESGGLYCRELARHLDAARPVYAVPPCGFDGRPIPASYEAAAALHVEAIRGVQPRGPYHLGGHCNGGLVALEIARRLRSEGEDVASLVLLGASAQNVRFRTLATIVEAGGRVTGAHAEVRHYAFRRLRDFAIHAGECAPARRWRFAFGKLGALGVEAAQVVRMGWVRSEVHRDPGVTLQHGHRERIRDWYVELESTYVPRRYRGSATLLWPRDDPTPVATAATAWRRVVSDLAVVEVPGNHHTSLTRHVRELAQAIEAVLDATRATAGTGR